MTLLDGWTLVTACVSADLCSAVVVDGSISWVLTQDKGGVVEQCKASEEQSALDSSKGTFIRSRPIDPRLKIPRTNRSASQTECLGVSGQLSNCRTVRPHAALLQLFAREKGLVHSARECQTWDV